MKKSITSILIITSLMFVVSFSFGQHKQHSNHNNNHYNHVNDNRKKKIVVTQNKPIRPNFYPRNKVIVVQKRNYRSYNVLPRGYKVIYHRGKKFHYHNGNYYSYYSNRYHIIPPPIGIRISILPVGYKQIFFAGIPYFYYRGAYYQKVNDNYETVAPSVGTIVPELPEDDVEKVTIDDNTYYEYDGVLYKQIPTETGLQYEVVGNLEK